MKLGRAIRRWRWWLVALAVVVALVLMSRAKRVHSFAYITRVDVERSVAGGRRTCDVYARLPKLVVFLRPPAHNRAWLTGGSIEINDTINDTNKTCEEFKYTWQAVDYFSDHPERAIIDYQASLSWEEILVMVIVAGLMAQMALERRRENRAANGSSAKSSK